MLQDLIIFRQFRLYYMQDTYQEPPMVYPSRTGLASQETRHVCTRHNSGLRVICFQYHGIGIQMVSYPVDRTPQAPGHLRLYTWFNSPQNKHKSNLTFLQGKSVSLREHGSPFGLGRLLRCGVCWLLHAG